MNSPKYRYFVSYSHNKGFGNALITTNTAIESSIKKGVNAMKEIQETLEKVNNVSDIIILYFKKL